MASYRRLPSGKWQAAVKLPDGRRVTKSDPLKRVLVEWATEVELAARRGMWQEQTRRRLTVGQWREEWAAGRIVEPESQRRDRSSWDNHLQATFEHVPLRALGRAQVAGWVKTHLDEGAKPVATRKALDYLKVMLEGAVHEGLLAANVARSVPGPRVRDKLPDWFTAAEVDALCAAMPHPPDRVMTRLMCWGGLRWGEAAGLRGIDVDWAGGRVHVRRAMTQVDGVKDWPKTKSSVRQVPVPRWLLDEMLALAEVRGHDGLLFTTRRQGRPLTGANWRVMFDAAKTQAGVGHGTPHTCRHTAASWLVQAGVPLLEVSRQLGHSSIQMTMRYAHLAPDNHDSVTGAWEHLGAPGAHEGLERGVV